MHRAPIPPTAGLRAGEPGTARVVQMKIQPASIPGAPGRMMSATSSRTPVTAAISSTIPSGATLPVSGVGAVGRSANMMAAALISSQADAQSLLLLVMVTMLARTGDHGRVAGRGAAVGCPRRAPTRTSVALVEMVGGAVTVRR